MNKKISELPETIDVNGLYILGTKSTDGVSVKYNLGTLDNKLNVISKSQFGDTIETFSTTKNYYSGQYVEYNGKLYKFIKFHRKGEWEEDEVAITSVFDELTNINSGETERLHISVSFYDGLYSGANRNVYISYENGNTELFTMDQNGNFSTPIRKGTKYSLSVSNVAGYKTVNSYNNIEASIDNRYVDFVYFPQSNGSSNVNIEIVKTGGLDSDINGTSVSLLNKNNNTIYSSTISNMVATFTDIPKDVYTLKAGLIDKTSYRYIPHNIDILPILNTEENIQFKYVYNNSAAVDFGIYVVDTTTTPWTETILTDDLVQTLNTSDKDRLELLHVCTKELIESGFDYYVRTKDLSSEWAGVSANNKTWGSSNVSFPNVKIYSASNPNYNGPEATYYMLSDAFDLGISSAAATYASSQRLYGSYGYIGTREQMNPLYTNHLLIYDFLQALGYTPKYYSTYTSSSSQTSATNNSWVWLSSGVWNLNGKTYNFTCASIFCNLTLDLLTFV